MNPRWTHLIRFSEAHTGYATLRQGNSSSPDHLMSVGDNVHVPGQTVAVFDPARDRWTTKAGNPVQVLRRPKGGQAGTPIRPHKVLKWMREGDLCIPWIVCGSHWAPAPFRPTCDDVVRMIDESERLKRRGRAV